MATIDEIKEIATQQLKLQLDMAEKMALLSLVEVIEFNKWYKKNEYFCKLQELVKNINDEKRNLMNNIP